MLVTGVHGNTVPGAWLTQPNILPIRIWYPIDLVNNDAFMKQIDNQTLVDRLHRASAFDIEGYIRGIIPRAPHNTLDKKGK